jgi:hypothetical protein
MLDGTIKAGGTVRVFAGEGKLDFETVGTPKIAAPKNTSTPTKS